MCHAIHIITARQYMRDLKNVLGKIRKREMYVRERDVTTHVYIAHRWNISRATRIHPMPPPPPLPNPNPGAVSMYESCVPEDCVLPANAAPKLPVYYYV